MKDEKSPRQREQQRQNPGADAGVVHGIVEGREGEGKRRVKPTPGFDSQREWRPICFVWPYWKNRFGVWGAGSGALT